MLCVTAAQAAPRCAAMLIDGMTTSQHGAEVAAGGSNDQHALLHAPRQTLHWLSTKSGCAGMSADLAVWWSVMPVGTPDAGAVRAVALAS